MKIIGYFVDKDEEATPSTVMVVIESEDELLSYSPIGQHSSISQEYVEECTPISKDEYISHSKGFFTPNGYLGGSL